MRCTNCGYEGNGPTCPRCGALLPEERPIEPEILSDEEYERKARGTTSGGIRFYRFERGGAAPADSCLPAFLTLLLAFVMGARYGALEAFCFLIFTGIGKGVAFFIFLKGLLIGRHIDRRISTIFVWLASWLLVLLLRGPD